MKFMALILIICGFVASQSHTFYGNPAEIMFPGPVDTSKTPKPTARSCENCRSSSAKSLELAKRINEFNSIDEFLDIVIGVPETEKDPFIGSRFGVGERSNAIRPLPARCEPELQPVSLADKEDTSEIIYPTCTRVKRCGGCCSHASLSCQPLTTEIRNFEIFVSKITTDNKIRFKTKRIVPLEEHTSCHCDCKMKPEHCSDRQVYIKDECKCSCPNFDEEEKCKNNNDTKLWDPAKCACVCRRETGCNSDYYFDLATCSCQKITSTQWNTHGWDSVLPSIPKSHWSPPIVTSDSIDLRRKHKDEPN